MRLQAKILTLLTVLGNLSSCAQVKLANQAAPKQDKSALQGETFTTADGKNYSCKFWNIHNRQPEVIIIGVHGLSGHFSDYDNFGKYLIEKKADIGLCSYNLRGQGSETQQKKRGDVLSSALWIDDLKKFSNSVQKLYPKSKIVWMGESLGSLIVTNSYQPEQNVAGIVLSSPIASLDHKINPADKRGLLLANIYKPSYRISLQKLYNDNSPDQTKVTGYADFNQNNKPAWYLENVTARLLVNTLRMIDRQWQSVKTIKSPVLIVHGAKDQLIDDVSIGKFSSSFSSCPRISTIKFNESHHLLMYDIENRKVFSSIVNWLSKLG